MKRKLLRQIKNEWKSNFWLMLELLIVSVVLWFVFDKVNTTLTIYNLPRGFDYEHVYKIDTGIISNSSPEYDKSAQSQEKLNENMQTLLERLQQRPEIEAAAFSINAHMYNGSNNNTAVEIDSFNTFNTYIVQRTVTPDFVRVFRFEGENGETPEQLAKMMKDNPNIFFMNRRAMESCGIPDLGNYVGRVFKNSGNGSTEVTLKGLLKPVRYDDFRPINNSSSSLFVQSSGWLFAANELTVRVKENMDKDFIENFMKDAETQFRIGNLYISGIESLASIRERFQRTQQDAMRNNLVTIAFLCFNIFLGILGTFWFRSQQRVHETAIRRVNGATRSNIFRRMISEGLMLLTLVTPFAAAIDYLLVKKELNTWYEGSFFAADRFCTCVVVTYVLIALMVIIGSAIPAYRTMKIQPATALSEE